MTITQATIDRLRGRDLPAGTEWERSQVGLASANLRDWADLLDAAERSLAQEAEYEKWVAAHQIDTDSAWRKARSAELEAEALRAQVAEKQAEVERLTRYMMRHPDPEIVTLRAQVAQLREALENIASGEFTCGQERELARLASMPDKTTGGPSQEDTAGSEAPKPCNEVRPGSGYCDMCSQVDALRAAEIRGMEMAATIVDRVYLSGDIASLIRAETARLKEGKA